MDTELEKQPYLGLRIGQNVFSCYYPFILDIYNNCGHGCYYCFSNARREQRGNRSHGLRAINVKWLSDTITGAKRRSGRYADCQKLFFAKRPLKIGNVTDPFPPWERFYNITLKVIRLLAQLKYPYIITTKGGWVADHVQYMNAFENNADNIVAQVSFSALNSDLVFEPRTSFDSRVHLIEALTERGVLTHCRICLIPELYDKSEIEEGMKVFKEAGATGVIVEHLHFKTNTPDGINKMSEIIGYDLAEWYKLNGVRVTNNMFVSPYAGLDEYILYKNAAHGAGMKFYAAEEAFAAWGDELNCCGASKLGVTHAGNMRSMLTGGGLVKDPLFGSMKAHGWFNVSTVEGYHKAKDKSVNEMIKDGWDDPDSLHSPACLFYGVEDSVEDGQVIYKKYLPE